MPVIIVVVVVANKQASCSTLGTGGACFCGTDATAAVDMIHLAEMSWGYTTLLYK
jgi:hypothetical protein